MAFPKKDYILAASYSLRINSYDFESGLLIDEFMLPQLQANCVVPLVNEPGFMVGSYSSIFGYDLRAGSTQTPYVLVGHEGNVTGISVNHDILYSCGEDYFINGWDLREREMILELESRSQPNAVLTTTDNNIIITCGEEGEVETWDIRMCATTHRYTDIRSPIRSMDMSPNGNFFLAACHNGVVVGFNYRYGTITEKYRVNANNTCQTSIKISPDARTFATAASDNTAKIFSLETGELIHNLDHGKSKDWIWGVGYTSDSSTLVTGGSNCLIQGWDTKTGELKKKFPPLMKGISCIAMLNC